MSISIERSSWDRPAFSRSARKADPAAWSSSFCLLIEGPTSDRRMTSSALQRRLAHSLGWVCLGGTGHLQRCVGSYIRQGVQAPSSERLRQDVQIYTSNRALRARLGLEHLSATHS